MVFQRCTGGGGNVGRVTHCGDAPADWRGALAASVNADEEDIVRADEEVEAIVDAIKLDSSLTTHTHTHTTLSSSCV